MRRDEIFPGVEYCETGPHAYGREPSVAQPNKIRFLTTNPNMRLVVEYEWQHGVSLGSVVPQEVGRKHLPVGRAVAYPEEVARLWRIERESGRANPGNRIEVVQKFEPGSLACERWTNGQWVPGMGKPAAVHRTWEQWEEKQAESRRFRAEEKLKRAPNVIKADLASAAEAAVLLKMSFMEFTDEARQAFEKASHEANP